MKTVGGRRGGRCTPQPHAREAVGTSFRWLRRAHDAPSTSGGAFPGETSSHRRSYWEEPLLVTEGRGHAISPCAKVGCRHACVASRHTPPGLERGLCRGVRGLQVFLTHPEARQHRQPFAGRAPEAAPLPLRTPPPTSPWAGFLGLSACHSQDGKGTNMWLALGIPVLLQCNDF